MKNSPKSIIWAAIQSLVSRTVDTDNSTNPAGEPNPKIPKKKVVYTQGYNCHEYTEVALPVYGTPCIEMDGKWYALSPGRFAVITPGVEHVEGCDSQEKNYTLLWLIFSKQTMICFACQHILKNGWKISMNCSLSSPRVNILRKLIKNGNQEFSAVHAEEIRINILAVLSELYAKEIEKSQNTAYRNADKFSDVLDSLYDFIDTHYADQINVEYLAKMAGISTCYLNRLFKRKFGLSVQEQIIGARMTTARDMLETGKYMIKQIAAKCGYNDPLYFSKAFKKYYGCSPSDAYHL